MNKISFYKRSYLGFLGLLSTTILEIFASSRYPVFAQSNIIPDDTLGSENSIVVPLDSGGLAIDAIAGGATRGSNLFHSFKEFNVGEGRSSYFFNNDNNLQNILTRVTGNNPSNILGTLGISNLTGITSNPNLYLINPNGIVFGENASLDVGGSFVATTADGIEFGEQGVFRATNPEQSSLLSVNPSALFFNAVNSQSAIVNRSRATSTLLGRAFNGDANRPINGLQVLDGKSLLLVGGNVSLDGGKLFAPGGRVDLASIAGKGRVELNQDSNNLSLSLADTASRGNISLTNDGGVIVTAGGGGDIVVKGKNIDILGGSSLEAGILSQLGSVDVQAGDITLDATEKITIANPVSEVNNDVNSDAVGNSGDINIVGKSVEINDGGRISASTDGMGNAGSINILGENTVSVKSSGGNNNSFIFNNIRSEAMGNTSGINITTGSLAVTDGAQIQSLVYGEGNSGKITIDARDQVSLDGRNANDSPSLVISRVEVGAVGNGGDVDITTSSLSMTNRAQIISATQGRGNAGSISINAQNQVFLLDSDIITEVSEEGGVGKGGDININTGTLLLQDGSSLLADLENIGKAGNITINVRDRMVVEGEGLSAFANATDIFPSQISTTVESDAVGEGGNIDITTGLLLLNDDGFISSDTSGDGKAGNINIKTNNLTLRNDARVSATTFSSGDAGNLNIITDFFRLEDTSQLGAITFGEGDAGTLRIKASEIIQLIGSLDENRIQNGGLFASAIEGSGNGGNLILETDKLIVQDGATISASNFQSSNQRPPGTGSPGNLSIDASSVTLDKGSITTATSVGSDKNRGNISINVRDNLTATNSTISTTSEQSSGGAINITAKDIRLFDDSDIRTNVFNGTGGGGNINLTANTIVAVDDSDILSFARDGKGGDITFNTEGFFSTPLYRPSSPTANATTLQALNNNSRVDVNASGTVNGAVTGVPDVTFIDDELTDLPDSQIDTNALIANSCISRGTKRQENSFIITGAGALRNSPGDGFISKYSTGDVRNVSEDNQSSEWKKGEPIIEPQGVYQLASGELILSRECK